MDKFFQKIFISLPKLVLFIVLIQPNAQGYSIGPPKLGKIEKFPYQVLLIGKQLWRKHILCGGTLLDNRWVLTAAHCVTGVTHFDVHLGAKSFDKFDETGRVIVRANKFLVHERFNPNSAAHDIALVRLPEPIRYTNCIQPATLPYLHKTDTFKDARVIATGWGSLGAEVYTAAMQFTELRVVSNEECAERYNDGIIRENVICAKGLYLETVCTGDSGGPLVLKGTQIIVGVTSFGPAESCNIHIPGGFTRVTHYLDWIDSKIVKRQSSTNYNDNTL